MKGPEACTVWVRSGEGREQNLWERTPGEEAGKVGSIRLEGPCHVKKMRIDPTRYVGAMAAL